MRVQSVWVCSLVLLAAVGSATAQPPGGPGDPGGGPSGPRQLSDANKALLDKVTAWVKANNSFGPENGMVAQVAQELEGVLSEGKGFSLTFDGDLVKGKKPVVLGGWGGEFFLFDVPDEAVTALGIKKGTRTLTSFSPSSASEPAESEAKLATLAIANAKGLKGDQPTAGSVTWQSLKQGQGPFTLRLVALAGKWVRTCHQPLNGPIPGHAQTLTFDFPPINTDGINHSGPMLVFIEICSSGKPGQKETVVSNPVGTLVFVDPLGVPVPGKVPPPGPPVPGMVPLPAPGHGDQQQGPKPQEMKDSLVYKVREWPGGTFATFDGWDVSELPNDLGGKLYGTAPKGRGEDFYLLLFVATPNAQVLKEMFTLGPELVKLNYPHLQRVGEARECTFGGDEARLERYEGKLGNRQQAAQAVFIRKGGVAVIVFGIGTEAGFKEFGRATEIVAQSLSFKVAPLEAGLIGTWTFSAGQRRELSRNNVVNSSSDATLTIYPNGTFTEYSQGYVAATGTAGDYVGSANWIQEGGGRGRIVKIGDVLTFHYDDGKTWSGPYKLEGANTLTLGKARYVK